MATKSVRPEQVQKAVAALLKFVGQQEQTNLLEDDELLHLVRGAAACRAATCMSIRWHAPALGGALRAAAGLQKSYHGGTSLLRRAWDAWPSDRLLTAVARCLPARCLPARSLATAQVIALKKIPQKPRNDKPVRIHIPHPIYAVDNAEVCLFVKDHKGALGGS